MCGKVAAPCHNATARLATATACAASDQSMTRRRSQRSASTPPGSPTTSWATASTASTRPDAAAEPVTISTTSGKAMREALKPTSDSAWLPHSSV
jgi:hypothetical protein